MSCVMNRMALVVLLLWGGAPAWAMVCGSGGGGLTESTHDVFQHACYEYYFNNSGAARSSGEVVVFDTDGTGVNTPEVASGARNLADTDGSDGDVTNIGTYIEVVGVADSPLVAGVIDEDACVDQGYCRVQVRGPRHVLCADSGDAVSIDTAVGTTTRTGMCGGGNGLGVALEAGDGGDADYIWVWVDVGGNR